MNNRDPFNIRYTTNPSSLLRPATQAAAHSVDVLNQHLRSITLPSESSEQAPEISKFNAAGGMSQASSYRTGTPNIETARTRDTAGWQPRRINHSDGNGVGEKVVSAITGRKLSRDELPMYKDKPYNYTASRRSTPFYQRPRVLITILGALTVLGYFGGFFSGSSTALASSWLGFGFLSGGSKINSKWAERQQQVKDAFKTSWREYEKHAWGFDVYKPVSQTGDQMVPNGFGWIIVDALDTMILMNLTEELGHARHWIANTLNYDQDHDVNTFETTIRMLGGLLSAQYLTTTFPDMAPLPVAEGAAGEDLYLEKATDLADRLLGAYESKSGVPYASINLHKSQGIVSHNDGGASSTAEAATLQLEMKYLAKLTGEKHYWDVAEKVIQVIDDLGVQDGLVPIFLYADEGTFRSQTIRLGSRGDSYYEYLIKQYLQTERQEPVYLEMWNQALHGVRKHLLAYSNHTNLTILGERPNGLDGVLSPKMDHLVCFMPGTIALAATEGLKLADAKRRPDWGYQQEQDMALARELMKTCWGMYKVTATGLSPEIAYFHLNDTPIMTKDEMRISIEDFDLDPNAEWRKDFDLHANDLHNLQRPETVESLFYMWRITGDEKYRDWGWEMFESFMEHTSLENGGGFTSIGNVDVIPPPKRDNMESFWLAETLKYFYLLFGQDDVLPLDQVVFNTEAHPFPRFPLGKLFSTGWKRKPRDASGNLIVEKTVREEETLAPAAPPTPAAPAAPVAPVEQSNANGGGP